MEKHISEVKEIVFYAIEEANKQLAAKNKVEPSLYLELIGPNRKFDSLGLVNVIVAIEEQIEIKYNKFISILGEDNNSSNNSPLKSVKSLIEYLAREIG